MVHGDEVNEWLEFGTCHLIKDGFAWRAWLSRWTGGRWGVGALGRWEYVRLFQL